MILRYGGDYRFKNGWDDWKGGYLDGNPENQTVYTGAYNQRNDYRVDGTSSMWRILPWADSEEQLKSVSQTKKNQPVLTNDVIYLKSAGIRYLDTAGRGCNDNLLCTSLSRNLPPNTGGWRIRINDSDEAVEIGDWVGLHLQCGRDDWSGGYLATRGYAQGKNWSGSVPLVLSVSTHERWDGGDDRSATWRVEPSGG